MKLELEKNDILKIEDFGDEIVFSVISQESQKILMRKIYYDTFEGFGSLIEDFLKKFGIIPKDFKIPSGLICYAFDTLNVFQLSKTNITICTKGQDYQNFLTSSLIKYVVKHKNHSSYIETIKTKDSKIIPPYIFSFQGKNCLKHFANAFEDAYNNDISNADVNLDEVN